MSFKEELTSKIEAHESQHLKDRHQLLSELLDKFANIDEPPTLMHMVVGSNFSQGARSHKLGNIRLNWRRLFESSTTLAFAGAGAATDRWLIPFAALIAWKEVRDLVDIRIEPREAVLLEAMWIKRNPKNRIKKEDALKHCNKKLTEYNMHTVSEIELENSLSHLSAADCIELDGDEIWLREWVSKKI